jgi:hypothetical protein
VRRAARTNLFNNIRPLRQQQQHRPVMSTLIVVLTDRHIIKVLDDILLTLVCAPSCRTGNRHRKNKKSVWGGCLGETTPNR